MARHPPRSPTYRDGRWGGPRRAWLVGVIVIGIALLFVIRHTNMPAEARTQVSHRPFLLRRAQAQLRADPNVADLVYSPARDQWDVTPASGDADARSFGRYLCFTLAQAGVTEPGTSVRIIDAARLEASGFDYSAASRGTVRCTEETP